jgi:hypothetical protein
VNGVGKLIFECDDALLLRRYMNGARDGDFFVPLDHVEACERSGQVGGFRGKLDDLHFDAVDTTWEAKWMKKEKGDKELKRLKKKTKGTVAKVTSAEKATASAASASPTPAKVEQKVKCACGRRCE